MDTRPQIERTARRALTRCVCLIGASTILGGLGGLCAAALAVHHLKEK